MAQAVLNFADYDGNTPLAFTSQKTWTLSIFFDSTKVNNIHTEELVRFVSKLLASEAFREACKLHDVFV
mgnify:CR=1 FL=1|jgi:hypothetical protein